MALKICDVLFRSVSTTDVGDCVLFSIFTQHSLIRQLHICSTTQDGRSMSVFLLYWQLSLGRMVNFPAFIASKSYDLSHWNFEFFSSSNHISPLLNRPQGCQGCQKNQKVLRITTMICFAASFQPKLNECIKPFKINKNH